MPAPVVAPFGSWSSPIGAARVASAQTTLLDVLLDGDALYVVEARPREGGRQLLLRLDDDADGPHELTPAPFSVRTRVHEYGGGAALMSDGLLVFSNDRDQRLYRRATDGSARPLTPAPTAKANADAALRYADGCIDRTRGLWIGVREDHRGGAGQEARNTIVALDLEQGGEGAVLLQGHDFYAAPRLSPDARQLAWLAWSHPAMPWEGCELWLGDFDGQAVHAPRRVAGGRQESIFQPEWSPDGRLHFISDRSGWWNLYRLEADDGRCVDLCPRAAEFGRAQWNLGMSSYAFLSADALVCSYIEEGQAHLARLDLASGTLTRYELPFAEYASVRAHGHRVAFRAGAPDRAPSVVMLDARDGSWRTVHRAVAEDPALDACLSTPRTIAFPTGDDGQQAYALFYPPRNPGHVAPAGELPPLLVRCHGGPTSSATRSLDLRTQFWTSRGVAVVDVDYSGSTGWGRAYRERLHRLWGVVDVRDCAAAARHLAAEGLCDPKRMVIRGSSAGGYTVLGCLTSEDAAIRNLFRAGASHYGVSDPAALAHDTHKFESRYLHWLIGPPEDEALYRTRSPVQQAARLAVPVAFFQGAQDRIVPPAQTEAMLAALRQQGLTAQYLLFAGEQHGFRQAANIQWALEAELRFFQAVAFGT